MYWSLVQALENGIGIHHGKFPKYVQNEVLRLFNNGDFDYLFCTSTIIEGVNTNAKNVVIINNSVGNTTMTAFALKNIRVEQDDIIIMRWVVCFIRIRNNVRLRMQMICN